MTLSVTLMCALAFFPTSASAYEPSIAPVSASYGSWTVVSTQSIREGEVGALLTHFNVYLSSSGKTKLVATFTGSLQGDGGETWKTDYEFASIPSGLGVTEAFRNFEPKWEIDPSGSVGTLDEKIKRMEWNGSSFIIVSSATALTLRSYDSAANIDVFITGDIFKLTGESAGTVTNEKAEVIAADRKWGAIELRVRFKDGREALAPLGSAKLPPKSNAH